MTKQTILIAGSGFSGLWAALSAARAIALAGREADVGVTMVSPEAKVTMRPRLYEAVLENMTPDISALLAAVGVEFVGGIIANIDPARSEAHLLLNDGTQQILAYERFVLATGSRVATPPLTGLSEYGFNVDQFETAMALDTHIRALATRPDSAGRNTVVVAGGGFTGLETATEMPERLRAAFGQDAAIRIVIVDPASTIGADMGAEAASVVHGALHELGIEQSAGSRVAAVDAEGITLDDGSRIEAQTLVWTAGMRAHPLTRTIPGDHDPAGRVISDAFLRAPDAPGVFVTGDAVKAATDDAGNFTVMSCQHALSLGRVAGHNAAAEIIGLPLHPYSQPKYVTCLDLGAWGALYTEGWDRQVRLTRAEGKAVKQEINGVWIYPPAPDRDAAFAVANPDFVIVP